MIGRPGIASPVAMPRRWGAGDRTGGRPCEVETEFGQTDLAILIRPTLAKPTLANPTLAKTDFGQN